MKSPTKGICNHRQLWQRATRCTQHEEVESVIVRLHHPADEAHAFLRDAHEPDAANIYRTLSTTLMMMMVVMMVRVARGEGGNKLDQLEVLHISMEWCRSVAPAYGLNL
jgi:hypothetical protein